MISLFCQIALLQLFFSCAEQREPEIYLIPIGFVGKVNVIFNQTYGNAIKYEDGKRIYEIPRNGILLTQFKEEDGFTIHHYYYVDSTGTRLPLKIFLAGSQSTTDDVGVFRDGTVGVYGSSDNTKSLSYQEFYVTKRSDFERYFSREYQEKFEGEVKELTGYDF